MIFGIKRLKDMLKLYTQMKNLMKELKNMKII